MSGSQRDFVGRALTRVLAEFGMHRVPHSADYVRSDDPNAGRWEVRVGDARTEIEYAHPDMSAEELERSLYTELRRVIRAHVTGKPSPRYKQRKAR